MIIRLLEQAIESKGSITAVIDYFKQMSKDKQNF